MAEEAKGKAAREEDVNEEAPPHRLTEDQQRVGQREDEPREGESPDEPPREEPPTPDDAEVVPEEEYRLVPNPSGQAGVPWEELRKGSPTSMRHPRSVNGTIAAPVSRNRSTIPNRPGMSFPKRPSHPRRRFRRREARYCSGPRHSGV